MTPLELLELIRASCPPTLLMTQNTDAIAMHLSAGRVKPRNKVPIADIQALLQGTGSYRSIKAAAKDARHPEHEAADAFMDAATSRYENIDLSLPKVQEMLGALVLAGAMPQADLDALNALAFEPDPILEFDVRCACKAADGTWIA